jgi:hypothetical protein
VSPRLNRARQERELAGSHRAAVTLHRDTAVEMTKKDSEKETDRPHYYSQFWLDVAAGRKIIGSGRAGEEEGAEPEPQETAPRKSARSSSATIAREEPVYREVTAPPEEEEAYEEEEYEEPEAAEDFLGGEEEFDTEQELPNILVEEAEVPDMKLLDEDEEEDFYDEEEEEEEEDVDWGRGRKKPKPGRQTKQPPKRSKRDRRY